MFQNRITCNNGDNSDEQEKIKDRTKRKHPEIFSTFSKLKETIVFVTKLVQNDCINQNLVKFSHKTPKNVQFLLKTLISHSHFSPFGIRYGLRVIDRREDSAPRHAESCNFQNLVKSWWYDRNKCFFFMSNRYIMIKTKLKYKQNVNIWHFWQ